ncbi:MAG: formate/nitrite transporter family protein [Clostridia bacterium]|nr:formate/nitrite transporter family protein [Clostridia bacterium]
MLKKIVNGISAGILISIGGSVFLACDNKYVGASFFTVALLCICYKGYSLFTGKVGYLPEKHGKEEFSVLLLGLLGNTIGTVILGYAVAYAVPGIKETALTICNAKLGQEFLQTLIRGCLCGVLMYLAVSIFRDHKTPLAIIFCIPVFILSGFEHSIADIFYFAASGIVSLKAFAFLMTVVLGNSIGAILLCAMTLCMKEKKKEE